MRLVCRADRSRCGRTLRGMRVSAHFASIGLLAVISLLLATGCQGESERQPAIQLSDGVVGIVADSDSPHPIPWLLEREIEVGVPDGDEDYVLRVPRALAVLEGGIVVILDDRPLQLRLYDQEGQFLRSFGQPGQGPADLSFRGTNTTVLRSTGPDRFEYWRGWPPVRQSWSLQGELLSVKSMPAEHPIGSLGRPYHLGTSGDHLWAVIPNNSVKEKRDSPTALVVLSDWFARESMQVVEVPEFDWTSLGDLRISVGKAQAESANTPMARYLVTRAGRIYASGIAEDWVHEYDPNTGRELRRFRLEMDRPFTILDSDVYPGDEGGRWWKENTWQAALTEGPAGQVWIQRTFEPVRDGKWPTDVFTSDGEYLGRLDTPFEPRTMNILGNQIFGFGFGAEGHPILVRCSYRPPD